MTIIDFKFPIVKKKRKRVFRILRSVFFISFILTLLESPLINKIEFGWFRLLVFSPMLIFVLSFVVFAFYLAIFKGFEIIGEALITNDSILISIDDLQYSYSLINVRSLKIIFNGSDGQDYDENPQSIASKDGTNNFLEFEESIGTKHRYELYIESDITLRHSLDSMKYRNIEFELDNVALKKLKRSWREIIFNS